MNDWIEHDGGPCPVPPETFTYVRFRDGGESQAMADYWYSGSENWWKWEGSPDCNIVGYRLRESEPVSAWKPIGRPEDIKCGVLLRAKYPNMNTWSDPYYGWCDIYNNKILWARWPHPFPPTHYCEVPT